MRFFAVYEHREKNKTKILYNNHSNTVYKIYKNHF